jgi:subtilase family serine protease
MKLALGIAVFFAAIGTALAGQPDRIAGTLSTYPSVPLAGSVYSKAQPQYDQGPVEGTMRLSYITLVTRPSATQQAALEQLLSQQQDPKSPNFRKWLTPEQYGDSFGMSQNDLKKLTGWLQSEGFSVVQVARARNWIGFSGTAAQVENTFQTEIHNYNVDGEQHFANATEIHIPQALNGIVVGLRGISDFGPHPMGIRPPGRADFFPIVVHPFYTSGGFHFLAPDDIATIYDITPLYNSGIDGSGMKLVVVGQTDINTADIDDFRTGFNLPAINLTQILATGSPDPGTTSDLDEADLDLEWSGAVARNANIIFVKAATSVGGVFASAQYAIDNTTAPVISMSYGGCESENAAFIQSNEGFQQQANSEGITFVASSGDEGAAACDAGTAKVAILGLAVNYPASSPEVTGVGGNEFNEGSGTYWNSSNGANGGSAISYIPEMAWNDTTENIQAGFGLSASGGGASSCGVSSGNTCEAGFSKPNWQTGTGVPNDGVRDVPDVSMAASADHDGYILCSSNSCSGGIPAAVAANSIVGGTSASAPVFAGIVVLLNQFLKTTTKGLGNINPTLYQLAANTSNGVFHDVTTGTNIVPCTPGTPSTDPTALQCPASAKIGYNAGAGYDLVTGWGSVDADALVTNFSGSPTTTTLTSSSNPANAGTSVTFTATVTGSSPTGTVTFNNGTTALGTGTLSSGKATFATSTLPAGGYSITAVYGGDSKNVRSTSAVLIQTIEAVAGTATTTAIVSSGSPAALGAQITFTATVTTTSGNAPGGAVTFRDGSVPLGFANVGSVSTSSGTAAFMTSALSPGTHQITGLYSGDANNNATSTSTVLSQVVNKSTSKTTLSAPTSVFSGATSLAISATVAGTGTGGPAPTGTVAFMDGSTPLGSGTLNGSGTASVPATASLTSTGAHSITAVYSGDSNYSTSTSAVSSVTVKAATFTFAAAPTTASVTAGSSASYTVTVTPNGVYTGQISFSCSFSPSSSATCSASPATLTPNGSSATTTLTVSGATAASGIAHSQLSAPMAALWMPTGISGILLLGGRKRSKANPLRALGLISAMLMLALTTFGCGGSSSTPPPTQTQSPQTYTITITATGTASGNSSAVTATQSVSLTVNPQ